MQPGYGPHWVAEVPGGSTGLLASCSDAPKPEQSCSHKGTGPKVSRARCSVGRHCGGPT